MLVNTSFNVRGEPIVCTPEDAYKCFMSTNLDVLIMNNFIIKKIKYYLLSIILKKYLVSLFIFFRGVEQPE